MTRRAFITGLGAVLAAPLAAEAQAFAEAKAERISEIAAEPLLLRADEVIQ